jgi:hypothetical protein
MLRLFGTAPQRERYTDDKCLYEGLLAAEGYERNATARGAMRESQNRSTA